jgi:hypothetical protein
MFINNGSATRSLSRFCSDVSPTKSRTEKKGRWLAAPICNSVQEEEENGNR